MGQPARQMIFDEGRKISEAIQPGPSGTHAGFWVRVVATIIDAVLLGAASMLLNLVAAGPMAYLVLPVMLVIDVLYFGYFESSEYQGTPGKMVLGLKVTDLHGQRIAFGKAIGRYFGKMLSALILCIGFIMVAFDQQKQGLHDKILGTYVVKK